MQIVDSCPGSKGRPEDWHNFAGAMFTALWAAVSRLLSCGSTETAGDTATVTSDAGSATGACAPVSSGAVCHCLESVKTGSERAASPFVQGFTSTASVSDLQNCQVEFVGK